MKIVIAVSYWRHAMFDSPEELLEKIRLGEDTWLFTHQLNG